jgi:FAD binding domain
VILLSSAEFGQRSITARFLVACDGAGSPTRKTVGIPSLRDDDGVRARWQGACVQLAGLREQIPHAPAVQYYAINPRRIIFGSLDGADIWRVTYPLNEGEYPEPEDVRTTIAQAVGSPVEQVEVIDTREWSGDAVVAACFRSGHVVLAGDAAHRMWPSGGHGMNTGLGDVANLGWKLDAVLSGWAPEAVLDTYTDERRPRCQQMVARAWYNYRADSAIRPDPTLDDPNEGAARELVRRQIIATRQTEWRSLGMQLDIRYPASSLVIPDGTSEPATDPERYEPSARPGHRAPHIALPDGHSVLDLFRGRFTLLNLSPDVDTSALAIAFGNRGIPLDVEPVTAPRARRLYEGDLVLVRPDGIVAWRANTCPPDAGAVVDQVTGRATVISRAC